MPVQIRRPYCDITPSFKGSGKGPLLPNRTPFRDRIAAIVDITRELGLLPDAQLHAGREQLRVIVAMLVALAKWLEEELL